LAGKQAAKNATTPEADHLTPLAFLDRPIFRIQFAQPFEFQILLILQILAGLFLRCCFD
jgi:hypothetical protein